MNHESQFVKRLKSFAWRFGAYIVVASLAWISANLGLLALPPEVTAVLALVLGEITKAISEYLKYSGHVDY